MSDYAIGDVQGCYDALMRLLESIDFNEHRDRLWFVGDLVNRGPNSLGVLRFVSSLPLKPYVVLGNHDLHLLSTLFGRDPWKGHDDTIDQVVKAPDGEALGHWLRQQSILHYSESLGVVMTHAGIAPLWDLPTAQRLAQELERALRAEDFREFLTFMYGNEPDRWSEDLQGLERLRVITNYFTRMRFCKPDGALILDQKVSPVEGGQESIPWFSLPGRIELDADIVFGHWAALQGHCPHPGIHAIDTGCFWGGTLTALRLQDKKRFAVMGDK